MHPFYVIRALGGLLFLTGALIMAWNLWKTVTAAEPQSDVEPRERVDAPRPVLVPAE